MMNIKTPHVLIKYTKGASPDKDVYSFAVNGQIPISHLIGYLVRVQAELAFRSPEPCDDGLCVILYDPMTASMSWFVDSKIPVDPLVGYLELLKAMLVDSQMAATAQQAAQQARTGLVTHDGKPILKR